MARPKKIEVQITEKKETTNVETKALEKTPKTMKVKMRVTYITIGLSLFSGKVYEIDGNLAMKFLKNGECEKC